MHVAKLFIPMKKSWKIFATWGVLWAQTFALRVQWDLSSWKQTTLITLLAIGTVLVFLSIWLPRDYTIENRRAGLYFLDFLKAKFERTWILFLIPLVLILIAYLAKTNSIIYSFFMAGALSFGFSLFFGKPARS